MEQFVSIKYCCNLLCLFQYSLVFSLIHLFLFINDSMRRHFYVVWLSMLVRSYQSRCSIVDCYNVLSVYMTFFVEKHVHYIKIKGTKTCVYWKCSVSKQFNGTGGSDKSANVTTVRQIILIFIAWLRAVVLFHFMWVFTEYSFIFLFVCLYDGNRTWCINWKQWRIFYGFCLDSRALQHRFEIYSEK